ncbi:MAG: PD-(D/E)XK nuclease domain-containing protein, partial [Clostridiales bacterium]|nr:PD-(D/E)XK nuclease domain-containing protein [Clostridiales bacterium]
MTRKENIIKGLNARIRSIDFAVEYLEKSDDNKKSYSRFYQEIAFLIHYIIKTEELKTIFMELVSYAKKLNDNPHYANAKNEIVKYIKDISNGMKNHPNYDTFKATCFLDFKNPLNEIETLRLEPLLNIFSEFEFKAEYGLVGLADESYQVIQSIYEKWTYHHKEDFEKIADDINLLYNSVNDIRFAEEFEHDYHGVKSALNLSGIYSALNPRTSLGGSIYHNLINGLIHKGEPVRSEDTIEELKLDCHKIYFYLIEKLTTMLSIELTIDRFATYISLYYREKIKGTEIEKTFQKKFEEFIFRDGYYPISEAQVNDGRIDTLMVNDTNSFLCEFKQVDLGKTKEEQKELEKKIKSAQIQSSIYQER